MLQIVYQFSNFLYSYFLNMGTVSTIPSRIWATLIQPPESFRTLCKIQLRFLLPSLDEFSRFRFLTIRSRRKGDGGGEGRLSADSYDD